MAKALKIAARTASYLTITLCILVIGLSAMSFLGLLKPLIVISGSMEPTIATGSLVFSSPAPLSQVHPGDVVSLPRADGVLVTHRVTGLEEIDTSAGLWSVTMKGDANDIADSQPYVATEALVPQLTLPVAGTILAWVSNQKMILVSILCLVAGLYLALKLLVERRTAAAKVRRAHDKERLAAGSPEGATCEESSSP